ncbi:cupredoxin family copper-binding protein [Pararhizobium sp. IMCC21322]|uniref:cupredoxin domain-containing protein n=1 Tax=Pararhizobium sp. IMCC21322 TaxID=3067903 RepID=UPI00274237C3|nr:cupredoxin family copper-binding protein [Pararhizobium sp. IMCC21322]
MFGNIVMKTLGAVLLTVMLAGNALAAEHTVRIKGMKFQPANLSVAAGDTVTFINNDNAPHTATAKDGSFSTPRLGKGNSAKIKISKSGAFDYFCAVHPRMKGKIVSN